MPQWGIEAPRSQSGCQLYLGDFYDNWAIQLMSRTKQDVGGDRHASALYTP